MNKSIFIRFILGCLITFAHAQQYTINIPVYDYPQEELKNHPRQLNTFQVSKQVMKSYFYQPMSLNIYGLYNGELASVNNLGFLSFSRTTQYPDFTLIITQEIQPVLLHTNTINHWLLSKPAETALYVIKQHKDPETKLVYWKTQSVNIPLDRQVPIHAITILAKPDDVYVPLGITPTTKLPNIVLPALYVRRSLDPLKQALFVLNIKQFFAPAHTISKFDKLTYATLIAS